MTRCLALVLGLAAAAAAAPPPATAVAYRPDGKLLAVGTRGVVHLVDPMSGELVGERGGLAGKVTAVAFAKSGMLAVAAGEPAQPATVRLYPATPTGVADNPVAEFKTGSDAVYALAFSPDGSTLATAGYDRAVRLWDVPPKGETPRVTFADHSDAVYAVAFSPDGKRVASGAADRTVKVWDPATGKAAFSLGDPADWVYTVAWSPAGDRLAAGGVDKSVRVWEVTPAGGKLIRSAFAHDKAVTHVAFPADGKALYTVGEDRVVKAWDPAALTETKALPPQKDAVLGFAVRPDGQQLVVGRYDGVAELIDPASGKSTATPVPVRPKPPAVGGVSPDGAARGYTTRVAVTGTGLSDLTAVRLPLAGSSAAVVPGSATAGKVQVDITLPPDAAVGATTLAVTGPGGTSNKFPLVVDRFPRVDEVGATDSARTGQPVDLPATVVGAVDRAGDGDFYRFQAAAGQPIGVHLVLPAGGKLEPVLSVVDPTGAEVAVGDGDRLGWVAPAAGEYAVGVRDRSYRGGPEFGYRLSVGPVPVVTGVWPLAVARGTTTPVRLVGVNLGKDVVPVAVPGTAAVGSKVKVPVHRRGGDPVGPADVTVGEFPAVAVGPAGTAELPAVPGSADGVLDNPSAAGVVRFPATKGDRLVVEVEAARLGSPVDAMLEVLGPDGKPVPRAVLRCLAKTYTNLSDRNSGSPGLRLEGWAEFATDDYLFADGDLMRIKDLPKNPDDDCQFYAVDGARAAYLGTTPKQHAYGTAVYKVSVHPPGTAFPPNGMPLFAIDYRNDDGGPGFGRDAVLVFDPPADGVYSARVTDAVGGSGPAHAYRLTVRKPRPDFAVRFEPRDPAVPAGGAVPVKVTATRLDEFDGPIAVRFADLPAPFTAPPTVVEAGQRVAFIPLGVGDGPVPQNLPPLKLVATAEVDGKAVTKESVGGRPRVNDKPELATTTSVGEVTLTPGGEVKLVVKVDRRGEKGRIPVEVDGLPHGVRVQNIGLNGILVLPGQTEREITIAAEPWVRPTDRPFAVSAKKDGKSERYAAPAVVLKVRD